MKQITFTLLVFTAIAFTGCVKAAPGKAAGMFYAMEMPDRTIEPSGTELFAEKISNPVYFKVAKPVNSSSQNFCGKPTLFHEANSYENVYGFTPFFIQNRKNPVGVISKRNDPPLNTAAEH